MNVPSSQTYNFLFRSSALTHPPKNQPPPPSLSHLSLDGAFVPAAGDVDDEGPVVGLHEDARGLGTGGVVRGGAAPVRALHAAAGRLLHPPLTVVALLQRGADTHTQRFETGI